MEKENSRSQHSLALDLTFDVDIAQAAFYHVNFLEMVDKHPCLFSGKYLEEALRRYEYFWLPLAANHTDKVLAAPLDIEWVWHCHLLSPETYKSDCENTVNRIVDHKLMSKTERDSALEISRRLWQHNYENEPFDPEIPSGVQKQLECNTKVDVANKRTKIHYDIRAAVARQCTFFYNVSLPHYKDPCYLKACEARYKKFLFLKKFHPKEFLVPCYDNDLAWHTHQLFPVIYRKNTQEILGKVLHHDDSTTDRSADSFLTKSFKNTAKLWNDFYGENYSFAGGMYRGSSSRGIYSAVKTSYFSEDEESTEIIIDFVGLDRNPVDAGAKFKISVSLNGTNTTRIMDLRGPKLLWDDENFQFGGIDLNKDENILFTVYRKSGFLGSKSEEIASVTLDPNSTPIVQKCGGWSVFNTVKKFNTKVRNDISLSIEGRKRSIGNPLKFRLKIKDFRQCFIPENVEENFDVTTLVDDGSNKCHVGYIAEHSVLDVAERHVFNCRVIHNAHNTLLCAQIASTEGDLLAVVRNVNSSHLPLPTQVSPGFTPVSLSPKHGERAFLIKDNSGDWAVIIGKWQDTNNEDGGRLVYRAYFNQTGRIIQGSFSTEDCEFKIDFDNCSMDVVNGNIILNGCSSAEVPQYVLGNLAIGLLIVLCVPRPIIWKPRDTVNTEATAHMSLKSMDILVGCGIRIETPNK